MTNTNMFTQSRCVEYFSTVLSPSICLVHFRLSCLGKESFKTGTIFWAGKLYKRKKSLEKMAKMRKEGKRKKAEEKCSLKISASGDDGPKMPRGIFAREIFLQYTLRTERNLIS